MKSRFRTNKILTAAGKTKHTITTTEGKTIHNWRLTPLSFSLQRKQKRPENRPRGVQDAAASVMKNCATRTKESGPKTKITEQEDQQNIPDNAG